MALIAEALVALITGNVAVNALISDRMEPHPLTQSTAYPSISYFVAVGVHFHSHQNALGGQSGITGLASPLFQLDCWAVDYASVKDLAEKLRLAIQGFRGVVIGVNINGILLENERDIFEDGISDDSQRVHRVMTEYRVWHNEAQT